MKKSIVEMLNVVESIENYLTSVSSYKFDDDGNFYIKTSKKNIITFCDLDECDRKSNKFLKRIESFAIIPIPFMYEDALKFSQNVKIQNRVGWRLPNTNELYSIFHILLKCESFLNITDNGLYFLTSEIDEEYHSFKTISCSSFRYECLGSLHGLVNLLLIKDMSK